MQQQPPPPAQQPANEITDGHAVRVEADEAVNDNRENNNPQILRVDEINRDVQRLIKQLKEIE